MGLFSQRQLKVELFDWQNVDRLLIVAAFSVSSQSGVTLSIAPGNGGVGVTVRMYAGEKGDYAYAQNAAQLNELFHLIISKLGSSSEDIMLALEGMKILPADSLPAD
jgi:hypothetical protein